MGGFQLISFIPCCLWEISGRESRCKASEYAWLCRLHDACWKCVVVFLHRHNTYSIIGLLWAVISFHSIMARMLSIVSIIVRSYLKLPYTEWKFLVGNIQTTSQYPAHQTSNYSLAFTNLSQFKKYNMNINVCTTTRRTSFSYVNLRSAFAFSYANFVLVSVFISKRSNHPAISTVSSNG